MGVRLTKDTQVPAAVHMENNVQKYRGKKALANPAESCTRKKKNIAAGSVCTMDKFNFKLTFFPVLVFVCVCVRKLKEKQSW